MALRWKKDPAPTGLARICAGPRGSTLRIDGDVRVATVSAHGKHKDKWFWVAGWQHPSIPHKNTCGEPPQTEAEAKASAMAYVREFLTPSALGQEPCAAVCARSPAPEGYTSGTTEKE